MDSAELDARTAFEMWVSESPVRKTDVIGLNLLAQAFAAGYDLAQSQSTQGSGEWHPFWRDQLWMT